MQKQKRLSIEELQAKSNGSDYQITLDAVKGGLLQASQCHLRISDDGKSLIDECTGHQVVYDEKGGW